MGNRPYPECYDCKNWAEAKDDRVKEYCTNDFAGRAERTNWPLDRCRGAAPRKDPVFDLGHSGDTEIMHVKPLSRIEFV